MASLRALLSAYDLDPGDTIYVDTGGYTLLGNIVIAAEDAGVTIQGPELPGHEAILDRANTSSGSYVFELTDADAVTLSDLTITGGRYGVYASSTSGSDNVTVQDSQIHDNSYQGIYLSTGNNSPVISGNTVHGHSTGIRLRGSDATVSGNTVYNNSSIGILALPPLRMPRSAATRSTTTAPASVPSTRPATPQSVATPSSIIHRLALVPTAIQ